MDAIGYTISFVMRKRGLYALQDDTNEDDEHKGAPTNTELQSLQEEISQLQSSIHRQRRELSTLDALAEEYSSKGYARKVASLDSRRNRRRRVHDSHKYTAMAKTVHQFVPALNRLLELKDIYADHVFAKNYEALSIDMQKCLHDLGVEEADVSVGDCVNECMNVVEEVEDELGTVDETCVVEVLKKGYILKGNVVRLADVTVKVSTSEGEDDSLEPVEEQMSNLDASKLTRS